MDRACPHPALRGGDAAALVTLLTVGVGLWGINTTNVWGFAIANYVWWIGIGNAGTLISSLLLLTRQSWRASINRFAEAMTLFSVSIAGIFPIIHLGRPQYFFWLAPYPNTMTLWPQWRSALVWDFWAILSYLLFSVLFWYLGLIPDAATLRDRATTKLSRLFFGILALGWRGSARHWRAHKLLQLTMAALAVPLVCSVHSIVGLDFAASLMPGWQEPIFPPYFVVGAMYSGFAMVVVLAALIRWGLDLQDYVTSGTSTLMALVMLMASLIMGLSYATEWFSAWYGGEHAERSVIAFEFTGHYGVLYWFLLLFNVRAAAGILVAASAAQPARRRARLARHQRRHVAGAHPHHLEHVRADVPAEHARGVLHVADGLGVPRRAARRVRLPVSPVRALLPRDLDVRGA